MLTIALFHLLIFLLSLNKLTFVSQILFLFLQSFGKVVESFTNRQVILTAWIVNSLLLMNFRRNLLINWILLTYCRGKAKRYFKFRDALEIFLWRNFNLLWNFLLFSFFLLLNYWRFVLIRIDFLNFWLLKCEIHLFLEISISKFTLIFCLVFWSLAPFFLFNCIINFLFHQSLRRSFFIRLILFYLQKLLFLFLNSF